MGFHHVAITESTIIEATNSKTRSETTASQHFKLKGTAVGIAIEIECTFGGGSGFMRNFEVGGEMVAEAEFPLNLSGCVVNKPEGKGCVVTEGVINTEVLSLTTFGQGSSFRVSTPFEKIAEISISGCSIAGLNKTFPLSGSFKATPSGATLSTTHEGITTQGTLKFAGQKAGLESSITLTRAIGSALAVT